MSSYQTFSPGALASSIPTKLVSTGTNMVLFPFASLNPTSYTNNYQLWAGTCRQEQPPAGYDTASVSPGSSGSPQVIQPAVDVFVTYTKSGTTTPVTPAHVKLIFNSGSGTTCSDTWGAYTANASNQGSGSSLNYVFGAPFASSATTGPTASASGQTGTVTVCADYRAPGIGNVKANSAPFTDAFGTSTPVTVAISSTSTTGTC
jgi:hypothetical protein